MELDMLCQPHPPLPCIQGREDSQKFGAIKPKLQILKIKPGFMVK